jgi:hypothetical protein
MLENETRRRVDLDNTIDSFEEIYWADPFNSKESIKSVLELVE